MAARLYYKFRIPFTQLRCDIHGNVITYIFYTDCCELFLGQMTINIVNRDNLLSVV